jgi:hypothetical protein
MDAERRQVESGHIGRAATDITTQLQNAVIQVILQQPAQRLQWRRGV